MAKTVALDNRVVSPCSYPAVEKREKARRRNDNGGVNITSTFEVSTTVCIGSESIAAYHLDSLAQTKRPSLEFIFARANSSSRRTVHTCLQTRDQVHASLYDKNVAMLYAISGGIQSIGKCFEVPTDSGRE